MFAPAPSIVRSANHNPANYTDNKRSNIVYLKTTMLFISTRTILYIIQYLYRFYPNDSCTFQSIQSIFEVKKKNLPTVSSSALICRARCNTREYVQVTGVRYRILNVTYCKQPFRPRVERERERKREKKRSLSRIFRHAYTTRDARVTRQV